MASKRPFDDDTQDGPAQNHNVRRPRRENPIFRGDAHFFPSSQTVDGDIIRMRYPQSRPSADIVCSNNSDRPLLTPQALAIDAEHDIVGIVYNPRATTPAHLIREYPDVPNVGLVRIADTQFSVTGSVGVREMQPFFPIVTSVSGNVEFRNDAMRIVHDACGEQQPAFNQMLRTVAQRETFEETGFFCEPDAFEFVRFQRNWAIFKVHARRLRARTLDGCRAFVAQNPQEQQFRAGFIPFKVQIYVYGTLAEFYALIRTVIVRPAVERDIAGILLYKAREIEQFRVV